MSGRSRSEAVRGKARIRRQYPQEEIEAFCYERIIERSW